MINDNDARQSLQRIDNQASNTGERIGLLGRLGGAMGRAIAVGATAAIGGMTVLTGVIAKTGIAYNAMAENSKVAWETLLGGKEEAETMFDDIQKFAKSTQFDSVSVDAMAKYMHNAGLEGKGLFDELTKVADVAGAFNIPAAGAEELTRQMSQVRQAGVAYTEDLNILQDRGVPIYKAISEQLGITVGDVKKMASEGKLTSDIYLKAFDGIAKGVEGSSQKQSQTLTGMLSTLKDNLGMISGELTKGAFEKLKNVMESAMPVIEQFATTLKDEGLKAALSEIFGEDKINTMINVFNTVRDTGIVVFNGLKDTVKFVSDNFNILSPILAGVLGSITAYQIISTITSLMDLWKASTLAQTLAQGGLNAAMAANPVGVVILAIGALIAIGVALYRNWDTIKSKTVELWNQLGPFKSVLLALTGPFGAIIALGVQLYKNWDELKEKAKDVASKIKGFFDNMKIKIPDIKMPHFSVKNWSLNPADWVKSMPKLVIDWYATGTNFAPGGLTVVGERGPELLNIPRGSNIKTANETEDILSKRGDINVNVYPQKAVIDEKDIEREFQRAVLLYG